MVAAKLCDKPLAAEGLVSYRYPSRYSGYCMIGATDDADALKEAQRSSSTYCDPELLEVWDESEGQYKKVVNNETE